MIIAYDDVPANITDVCDLVLLKFRLSKDSYPAYCLLIDGEVLLKVLICLHTVMNPFQRGYIGRKASCFNFA